MTPEELHQLKRGDIIRNTRGNGESLVVINDAPGNKIAVRATQITNPDEWINTECRELDMARKTVDEFADDFVKLKSDIQAKDAEILRLRENLDTTTLKNKQWQHLFERTDSDNTALRVRVSEMEEMEEDLRKKNHSLVERDKDHCITIAVLKEDLALANKGIGNLNDALGDRDRIIRDIQKKLEASNVVEMQRRLDLMQGALDTKDRNFNAQLAKADAAYDESVRLNELKRTRIQGLIGNIRVLESRVQRLTALLNGAPETEEPRDETLLSTDLEEQRIRKMIREEVDKSLNAVNQQLRGCPGEQGN